MVTILGLPRLTHKKGALIYRCTIMVIFDNEGNSEKG